MKGSREVGDVPGFYSAALASGAILTGFCGTFLSFRLQRESGYHRQPAVSIDVPFGTNVYIGQTLFSVPLSLLLAATILAGIFGFAFPLLAIAEVGGFVSHQGRIAGGQIAALVMLAGYFTVEMIHYAIIPIGPRPPIPQEADGSLTDEEYDRRLDCAARRRATANVWLAAATTLVAGFVFIIVTGSVPGR